MLATILSILKIILIILLCILGLAVVLILLVLCLPFKYRIKSAGTENLNAKVNVNFLFRILSIWAIYEKENGFDAYVKVFGLKIFNYNKWKLKKEAKENDIDNEFSDDEDLSDLEELDTSAKKKTKNNKKDKNKENKNEFKDNISDINISEQNESIEISLKDENEEIFSDDSVNEDAFLDNKKKTDKSPKGLFAKLKSKKIKTFGEFLYDTFDKIWDFFEGLPDKINSFVEKPKEKIDSLVDTYIYYDNLFSKRGTDIVIEYLKKKVIKLLKHIKPRKTNIYVEYGSEDPVTVTKALEFYALLIPVLPNKTRFIPCYDEDKMVFDVDLKGHVIVGYCGCLLLGILFNKKVKKFIKLLKRER